MATKRTPMFFLFSLIASASAFTAKEIAYQQSVSTRPTLQEQCKVLGAHAQHHRNEQSLQQNHTSFDHHNDDDLLIPQPKFSKNRWKKKRYLMMQDVKRKIQRNDPQAVRKAEEVVRRMLTLYEKSGGDMDYHPTLQAYNMWVHALAKSNRKDAGKSSRRYRRTDETQWGMAECCDVHISSGRLC